MKKLKIAIILAITTIVVLISTFTIYAFFNKELGSSNLVLTYNVSKKEEEIDSYEKFAKYGNQYYYSENINTDKTVLNFNDESFVSNNKNRFIMKLTSDIKLIDNLTITSDCHIDLNGHSIDLSGKTLTIKNQFGGTMVIYDNQTTKGVIKNGNLVFDCENADIYYPSSLVTATVTNLSTSAAQVVNNAMKFVAANVQNANISDFYTIALNDTYSLGSSHELFSGESGHTGSNYLGFIYTYTDLELIDHYFTYDDMTISYTSSNPNVLSAYGNVVASTTSIVDLTVSITYKSVTLTKKIAVVVAAAADYEKAALATEIDMLEQYKSAEEAGSYELATEMMLPINNTYWNKTYVYSVINNENASMADTSVSSNYGAYFTTSTSTGNYYLLSLNSTVAKLRITVGSSTKDLNVYFGTSSYEMNNRSYALMVVRQANLNPIVITKAANGTDYTSVPLDINIADYPKLSSVSYQILEESNKDGIYTIFTDSEGNKSVQVTSGKNPIITDMATLRFTFTFNGGAVENIDVPIKYVEASGSDGINQFLPYYQVFDKNFKTNAVVLKTNGNKIEFNEEFTVPLTVGASFPVYKFFIYVRDDSGSVIDKDSNKYSMFDNTSGLFTIRYYYKNSGVDTEFAYGTTSLADLRNIVKTGTAYMKISINPYAIDQRIVNEPNGNNTFYDQTYYFGYKELFVDDKTTNSEYQTFISSTNADENMMKNYYSTILVPAVIRYNNTNTVSGYTEEFLSAELYKKVFDAIYTTQDPYNITTDISKRFILARDLDTHISTLDFNNNTSITSYKGINLLSNVDTLNMSNIRLGSNTNYIVTSSSSDTITYISRITNLKSLDLSNNVLTDYPGSVTTTSQGFPTGTRNDILNTLSSLSKLETLNISNNYIYNMNSLSKFVSLSNVNISNNEFRSNSGTGIWAAITDLIVNSFINVIYGSSGVYNLSTFVTLQAKGINITGFAISSGSDLYSISSALINIEYQEQIATGQSIKYAFSDLPTDYTSLGVKNTFAITDGEGNSNAASLVRIYYVYNDDCYFDGNNVKKLVVDGQTYTNNTAATAQETQAQYTADNFSIVAVYKVVKDGGWLGDTIVYVPITVKFDIKRY